MFIRKVIGRFSSNNLSRFNGVNDATQVFVESVSATVKGIQSINFIEEWDKNISEEDKKSRKRFLIYRSNPSEKEDQPKYMSYYVDMSQISPMYLDALGYIKDNMDTSLSYRRSCREGICGSCAMNCDGLHSLACLKTVDLDLTKPALITPLGHMFVLKDLIVDMTNFYTQYKFIEPFLKRKTPKLPGQKEYYQSEADRKKLDGLYECVLCACCSTSCPSYWWHPDKYLGPAVLMQAYRWIIDSRDEYTHERLEQVAEDIRLDDCQNIGMCTLTCPKGLDPQAALQTLMKMVKQYRQEKQQQELL